MFIAYQSFFAISLAAHDPGFKKDVQVNFYEMP